MSLNRPFLNVNALMCQLTDRQIDIVHSRVEEHVWHVRLVYNILAFNNAISPRCSDCACLI